MEFCRKSARNIKSSLLLAANALFVILINLIFRSLNPSNVNFKAKSDLNDGTGAQIHKQASIYCLSQKFGSGFIPSALTSIEIQHGDSFQTEHDVLSHIEVINRALEKTNTSKVEEQSNKVSISGNPYQDFFAVLSSLFPNLLLKRPVTFEISQAFKYIQKSDRLHYREFGRILVDALGFQPVIDSPIISVQTHLRVSTVNPVSDRYLSESYYLKFLHEVTRKLNAEGKPYKVIIHTDFNDSLLHSSDAKWSATPETIEYWKAIGVTDQTGELNLHTMQLARNILDSISAKFANVEVLQNNSPIEAWEEMAKADYLQISNSSFSFLGAIMNNRAKIYSPKNKQLSMPGWSAT